MYVLHLALKTVDTTAEWVFHQLQGWRRGLFPSYFGRSFFLKTCNKLTFCDTFFLDRFSLNKHILVTAELAHFETVAFLPLNKRRYDL